MNSADARPAEEFYDRKWGEWNDMIRYSPAPRMRRKKVLGWLKRLNISSLLDVGCGNGELLYEIRSRYPALRLSGSDISPAVIDSNRAAQPQIDFQQLDLEAQRLAQSYDLAVCTEVLEHCEDSARALKNLCDMAGRYLIISVPCGPIFEIDRRVGHHRHYRGHEMEQMLRNHGFKCLKIEEWGFPVFNLYKHLINLAPGALSGQFLSEKPYSLVQKLISHVLFFSFQFCLPRFGYQLLVLAEREEKI